MLAMSSNQGKYICYGVTNGSRIDITGLFPRLLEFARYNRSCWMETAKKGDALPDSYRAVAWPCNLWFPRSRPRFLECCKTGQTGNMLKSCQSNCQPFLIGIEVFFEFDCTQYLCLLLFLWPFSWWWWPWEEFLQLAFLFLFLAKQYLRLQVSLQSLYSSANYRLNSPHAYRTFET